MPYSDQVFRALLDAAPDAIVGVQPDGTIALVNKQTEALFGYTRDELVGQSIEILVPESARAIHPHHRQGFFAHPTTRPMGAGMELSGRRKDGSEFPAEISLSAIVTDDGLLVSAAVRDGTERKQAAIISSSSDAIISTDLQGVIRSWNRGAELLHAHPAAAMVGREVWVLVPDDQLARERDAFARAVRGERVADHETTRRRADGSVVDVSCTLSPLTDPTGAVVGVSSFAQDITSRKRVEAERQKLEDRLHQSERLESLGQLAGGVAHDFNNLLAVILNYASFAAEGLEGNDAAREDIEEIRLAAERAARLTHQLLLFGRRETTEPEVLDLDEVVRDVERLLSRTIGEHVDLVVHPAPEPPVLRADRGQLEQVLVNLAVNARDAMPDGGVLTIETAAIAIDEDSARLHPGLHPGSFVQLSVSDTGNGMSPEVLDHAFEPFFTTKPKGEGTGLGLATIYGIVTEAGGTVTIYSEPGMGTTVRVYLPAAAEDADALAADAPHAPAGPTGQTILVVEDEAAILKVTARILTRNGYRVLQASNGAEALELAATETVDLVLTDVVMPQMSGRELAERLRTEHPGVAVLFMSGYSQGVLGPQRGLDDGVALVQKPFTEQSLVEKVRALRPPPPAPL